MSNIIVPGVWSKYGARNSANMVRVLSLNGGAWGGCIGWVICSIQFVAKFLVNPSGIYFYDSEGIGARTGDQCYRLRHGQSYCSREDGTSMGNAYPTPVSFDSNWHTYYMGSNVGGNLDYVNIDGVNVRTINCANWMTQPASSWNATILGGVSAYIKNMQVYDMNGTLRYSWNWTASEGVGSWSNAEIKYVSG